MEGNDVILSLIGPIGPMVDFDEYMEYRDKIIKSLSLEEVIDAINASNTRYIRFKEDVEVMAIEHAEQHAERRQAISDALKKAGFDGLSEKETF